jgi:hypothetical protein
MRTTNIGRWLASLIAASLVGSALAQQGPPPVRKGRPVGKGPPTAIVNYLVPNSSALAAALDIDTVPPKYWPYTRYLSLYNIPEADRPKLIQTLSFMINSVSRARLIKPVTIVPGSENSLVRICLCDYQFYDEVKKKTFGWDPKIYDKLGDTDPYFHADLLKTVTKVVERRVIRQRYVHYGNDYYGKPLYRVEDYWDVVQEAQPKDVPVRGYPPWCDAAAMGKLIKLTQSTSPILRADHFLVQISLPPFYYELLDVGNKLDDFFDVFFVDLKQIERAKLEVKGVVVKSGAGVDGIIPVARNQRTLTRYQTLIGYLWQSRDTKTSVDNRDYLRILADEKFDATELIGTGRNGLQLYFLAKGNAADKPGERQDEAPIEIVVDNTNHDRRVRSGRSCVTCHSDGIRQFKPLPQEMVKNLIDVVSPDYKKAQYLRDTYVTNVIDFIMEDRKIYARAVKAATRTPWSEGLSTAANADQFGHFYNQYYEAFITPEMAAFECGMSSKDLLPLLGAAQNDPHLLGLSKGDPLLTVRRDNWEKSFQQAMILVLQASQRR